MATHDESAERQGPSDSAARERPAGEPVDAAWVGDRTRGSRGSEVAAGSVVERCTAAGMLMLQRTLGNQAAIRLLQRQVATVAPINDLAGIPENVRRTMKLSDLMDVKAGGIDEAYRPFTGGFHTSSPKPPVSLTQTVLFGNGVPQSLQVREGLRRVIFAIVGTGGALPPRSTTTLRIGTVQDLAGGQLPGGTFRFSRFTIGRSESVLVEQLGADAPAPEALYKENFENRYSREGYTLIGPGWTTGAMVQIALLDEALIRVGATARNIVSTGLRSAQPKTNLKFYYGPKPGETREDGHWDGIDTISLYYGIFEPKATRIGTFNYPMFVINHEFGHALRDFDTGATEAFRTAAASDGGAITTYGSTSVNESFSEAYATFTLDPDEARALRPNVFRLFSTRYPPGSP